MTTKDQEPVTIKKYANRRLYNTGTSTYVTLDDLAAMVKEGEDFVVYDAKSGEDITRSVLAQIIFEQENRGPNLLPITFLRQLIRFYGDSMQNLVPTYLDFSLDALTKDQGKLRSQLGQAFGSNAMDAIGEQVRRNTEIFQNAMRMFLPFSAPRGTTGPEPQAGGETAGKPSSEKAATDLDELKKQLDEVQRQLAKLTEKT
jgi:polyhydroxyalkanoate synthesis repressor PhaR